MKNSFKLIAVIFLQIFVAKIKAEDKWKEFLKEEDKNSPPNHDLILKYTVLSNDSLTPEIPLYLLPVGEHKLSALEVKQEWGTYFPGGQGLARYLLDNPDVVGDRRILDVGSGCGAVAIAAAKCFAESVVASDIDPASAIATSLNAKLNNVSVTTVTSDVIGSDPTKYECLTVGDMFQDEETVIRLVPWLKKICKIAINVLIGDPERPLLRKYFNNTDELELLANYSLSDYKWNDGEEQYQQTNVYHLKCR